MFRNFVLLLSLLLLISIIIGDAALGVEEEKDAAGNAIVYGQKGTRFEFIRGNPDLGSANTNKEVEVIREGKKDHRNWNAQGRTALLRKELMCAVFIRPSVYVNQILTANIFLMDTKCDWAIIGYDKGDEFVTLKDICNNKRLKKHLIHCEYTQYYTQEPSSSAPTNNTTESERDGKKAIPKTAMYEDLLPYLPSYKRVFMLDEDIFLGGAPAFHSTRLLYIPCILLRYSIPCFALHCIPFLLHSIPIVFHSIPIPFHSHSHSIPIPFPFRSYSLFHSHSIPFRSLIPFHSIQTLSIAPPPPRRL
jgi:hypothetical protein